VRIVGLLDRSGYVFDPRGLSRARLARLAEGKDRGALLTELGGQAAEADAALADIADHAVSRPILVDVTAESHLDRILYGVGGNFGDLKICKLTETPAYLGRQFSFQVNGGPIVSTEANDAFAEPQDLTCRLLGSFQVGSTNPALRNGSSTMAAPTGSLTLANSLIVLGSLARPT